MLKTKQVGIYIVSQMSALEGARLRIYQQKNLGMKFDDPAMQAVADEWAVVAACVTPHITLEDYTSIPLVETRPLLEAVEELNADIVGGETEPAKKKTQSGKQPKSTRS